MGAAVGARFGGDGFGAKVVRSGAQVIADAATRSLIEGTDFGDNVMAALPNAIGSLVAESIVGGIASRPRAVADAITDQIRADLGPNATPEQLAALNDYERRAARMIRDARRLEASDPAAADRVMGEVLGGAYDFYPSAEIDAMRGLIGHRSTVPVGPDDIAVTGQGTFGGNAFGLLDRPSIYAGRLQERVNTAVANWVENTPGAGLALNAINWGMMIAGGPTRLVAAGVYGQAQEHIEAAATQRFRDVEYAEQTSYHGGSGITWLGEMALSGIHVGRRHGPDRPDFQPTRPSGRRGDIDVNLGGRRSTADTSSTYRQENEVADMFAHEGYRIEQNPILSAAQRDRFGIPRRDPDYMIEGRPFDLYGPLPDATPRSIAAGIFGKTDPALRQADRVIVDLRGTSVTRGQLQSHIRNNPVAGLNELRVITTDWLGNPVIRTVRR